MKHVALVTCSRYPTLSESDQLLVDPLKKEGFVPHVVPWDKDGVDWSLFDLVVLRSCWNYYSKYPKFLSWLTRLEQKQIMTWNPLDVIRWNIQKTYLLDLGKKGIPIIPTIIIKKQSKPDLKTIASEKNWNTIVVKPTIGADAYGVTLIKHPGDAASQRNVETLLTKSDCIIQPLIEEIMTQGEYSFVFIAGLFSHMVQKLPKPGEFRSNYHFGAKEKLINPEKSLIHQATNIVKSVQGDILYARVDCVNRNGTLILMELELIEPHLYFDFAPKAATRFVQALKSYAR